MFSLKGLLKKLRGSSESDVSWKGMDNGPSFGSMPTVTSNWTTFASTNTQMQGDNSINFINSLGASQLSSVAKGKDIEDLRIEKKPVEIVSEIMTPEPVFDVAKIEDQIRIVEWRIKVVERYHGDVDDEKQALRYLKARAKWLKYGKKFTWPIATNELIAKLISTYKLENVSFREYAKNVPLEATIELEKFGAAWDLVMGKERQPDVRLIVGYIPPEKKPVKKDPILLVTSPFGNWWYILGAWDKEVEIVDQIVYKGQ